MTDTALLRTFVKPRRRAATDEELMLFEATCQRTGLDPLARQVYAQFRSNSTTGEEEMAIQATIDGFRVVAERSGDYLGGDAPQWCGQDGQWTDVWTADGHPVAARITIHKSLGGQVGSTTVVAHWKEYAPTGAAAQMWTKMPALMLAKVAEALALRRAFPMVLSGLYTAEEMAQAIPAGESERIPDPLAPTEPEVVTPPDVVLALKAVCREAKFNWAVIKECYERAEMTPPYAFADVFTGLDPDQAQALLTALKDRAIEFQTDVPYPAAEVESSSPGSGAAVIGDDAPAEPTPLLAGAAPIDSDLAALAELERRRGESLTEDEAEALLTNGEVPEPTPIPALTPADLLLVDALKRGDCRRAKVAEFLNVTPELAGYAVAELKAKLGVRSGQAVIELAERQ